MMLLLRLFFNICLLRQAPQDIPYSQMLLRILIVIYAIVAVLALLPTDNLLKTLFEVSVEIILIAAFVWGVLVYSQKKGRFVQVLCAFLGTDALISTFALPALAFTSMNELSDGVMIALFCLMVWHWVVCGHIIRHALSKTLDIGLGIAFLYSWGFYQVMNSLFPASG